MSFKKTIFSIFLSVCAIIIVSCDTETETVVEPYSNVHIGTLLSLSANWKDVGINTNLIVRIATDEVNDSLKASGSILKLLIRDEDTKLDPADAYTKIGFLYRDSCFVVFGPQTTPEIDAVSSYVTDHNQFLFSPGSTASSLAKSDLIFRTSATAASEGKAIAQKMYSSGVRKLVPVVSNDPDNLELNSAIVSEFTALTSSAAVAESVIFKSGDDPSQTAQAVATVVAGISSPGDVTAVVINGYDEMATVLAEASKVDALSSVLWFAGHGIAKNSAVAANPSSGAFCLKVKLCACTFGLPQSVRDNARYKHLIDTVFYVTGIEPGAMELSYYDAVYAVASAYKSVTKAASREVIMQAVIDELKNSSRATGSFLFDSNGDRISDLFDFYTVADKLGYQYKWVRQSKK